MIKSRKEVLYILGYGRSGTTILHNVLSQVDGFVGGGELREIWGRGWERDELCGCGEAFSECPLWMKVSELLKASGGRDLVESMQAGRSRARDRHLPLLLLPYREQVIRQRYRTYLKGLDRLYTAINDQTGCEVIVDSSKSPLYGYLLTLLPDTKVHFVHMVRDARGVDFSLWKRKQREIPGFESYRPALGALRWNVVNLMSELLGSHVETGRFIQLRYEDFARFPKCTVETILHRVGRGQKDLPFVDRQTVHLDVTHTVAGNGKRFRTGRIEIEVDKKWKKRSPRTNINVTKIITTPLLIKYGYNLG